MRPLIIFLFAILLLPCRQASCQLPGMMQDSAGVPLHAFSEGQWKRATRDMDYSKEKLEEKSDSNFLKNFHSPISAEAARIIIYSIIIALLLYILVKVFSGSRFNRNKKIKASTAFMEIAPEEELHDADLGKMYEAALAGKHYRLAIRLSYLMVIKELSSQEMIRWRKEKTNREYLTEMMNSSAYNAFREITMLFERTWYGEQDMTEEGFHRMHPKFSHLLENVKVKLQPVGSGKTETDIPQGS